MRRRLPVAEAGNTIRRAAEADVPIIVALNHALFQEDAGQRDPFMNLNWPHEEGEDYVTKLLHSEKSIGMLAERKGQAIGYLVGYLKPSSSLRPVRIAELESMYVGEEHRSQEVGQQLVSRFLEWVREQGAERVSVTAYVANEGAVSFYKRMGFIPKNLTLELGL
jgi:ribosomal protein S18 acetylase RimI-like enzyme